MPPTGEGDASTGEDEHSLPAEPRDQPSGGHPETAALTALSRRGPLQAGEPVLLVDRKRRRYLFDLETGGQFHCHAGVLAHDEIIGQDEGRTLRSSHGMAFVALRPALTDVVLKMPRGAQVVYPKDIGPILVLADIHAGVRVLEAGVGSGALSMALLRSGAEIVGYELRDDFEQRARRNVERFCGAEALARYSTEIRDVYEGIDAAGLDRIVLDLPEPWQVVPHAETALRPGGIFLAYVPSIVQAQRLREALEDSRFGVAETLEVLQRHWHIENAAVRPDHRMVAHTGFLTHARLLAE